MSKGRVLLLVGSAKTETSTSESLGDYLLRRLNERGFETEKLFAHKSVFKDDRRETFLAATDNADIVVLASPLYVDSLPYPVTKAMEMIASHRQAKQIRGQKFAAIVNSGFPEASQNDTAIAICRKFAKESGFEWSGGLALGGGEGIGGQPLENVGGMARNVIRSLDIAADDLEKNMPISDRAIALMAKPLMPKWIYLLFGEFGWRKRAKQYHANKKLWDRPYSE